MQNCDLSQWQKAGVRPCLDPPGTVAILAEGINGAVVATQAFFENGRRQFVILHH
jgi:hypothetical protein